MKKIWLVVVLLMVHSSALADLSSPGLYDIQLNPLSTNASTYTRNPLDIESMFSGSIIDPRSIRALTSSDVISTVQSGTWTVGLSAGTNSIGTVSTKTDLSPNSPTAVSVGVTSGTLIAANASRKGLILINLSANTVSIGFGTAAVLNSGITLFPHGSYEMDEFAFDTGALNAIASAASSSVSIQEFQ